MSNTRNPLRINVGFLLNQPIGTSRDIHFDLADYRFSPDFIPSSLQGVIRLGRTPQGVIAEGTFDAELNTSCVRCLTDFPLKLHCHFDELYSFKNHPTVDPGFIVPDDGNIDFAPTLREYLMLEIPIKVLCRPDCKGLCVECGENLNERACEHQKMIQI